MTTRISHNELLSKYVNAEGTDSSGTLSLFDAESQYETLIDALKADSPTFDDSDSDGAPHIDMSNTLETMDQDEFKWWSNDSDTYVSQISSRSV